MLVLATDWVTVSSLATAFGTLVLAVATFSSVRSASRSTRISENALEEQRRPVLTHSRLNDPEQKMMFIDRKWVVAEGGRACAEHIDGVVYLALSLRNVGAGMAVCQGWTVSPNLDATSVIEHAPLDQFRTQARDIYVPGGDIGMWQGALRDPDDPVRALLAEAIDEGEGISIELLYTDMVGAQRTITRFGLMPARNRDDDGNDTWYTSMSRHWHLDRSGPRADDRTASASEAVRSHLAGAEQVDPEDVVE
jgi:hypothetical protein